MKHTLIKILMTINLIFLSLLITQAQDNTKQLMQDAINTWDVLSTNIKIHHFSNEKTEEGVRIVSGSGTFFNHSVGLEVAYKSKNDIRRIMIDFPDAANLNTDQLRAIFGKDMNQILPEGFGTKLGIQHFEIDMENKKVEHVNFVMNFGTWAPASDNSGNSVTLSDITAEFGIKDIQSREPNILVALESYIFLPREAAEYIGLKGVGATELKVRGYANTETMKLALAVKLSSEEIPLVTDGTLVLRGAELEFAFENNRPQLAVGGQLEVRPPGEQPFQLKGDISIDVTGKVYAQGFMTKDNPSDPEPYIRNPFGLNDKIFITRAGLGFGLDFKTTPIPTPSLAIEGGIAIKNSPTADPLFAGAVTLAVDPTVPEKTIIDADVTNAKLSYIIDAFHDEGVPSEFIETLKKINLKKLHLTVVPPSAGSVEIFGRTYEPGFYAEGVFEYGTYTGAMLIDIDEDGVEVFGSMSPLDFQHFKLKGTIPNTGPYIYLSLKPNENLYALAINGKLEVMGANALTDIYLSDKGFNATLKTKIFNEFSAEVDIAGTDFLNKNAAVYAKVNMTSTDNLVKRIGKEASDEINRMADDTQSDFDKLDDEIAKYEPMYEEKGRELKKLQDKVRKRYQALCNSMNQKENNEKARQRKQNEIANLKKEINRLQNQHDGERFRKANPVRSTNCSGGGVQKIGDYCYTCPSGFKWNGPIITANKDGCISKTGSGFMGLERKTTRPIKGDYTGCDVINNKNGQCYECPKGYNRVVLNDVQHREACEHAQTGNRAGVLRNKRIELAALETAYGDLNKAISDAAADLSKVGADVCNKISDTDAINSDPEIASSQVYRDWLAYGAIVVNAREGLKTVGDGTVGSLKAAAWIAENAGQAAGIVEIHEASFEGCLSSLNGGNVAMYFRGEYADEPISGTFNMNLNNPTESIKSLANLIMNTNTFKASKSNGTCTRPNVPRPNIAEDSKIAELMSLIKVGTDANNKPKTKLDATLPKTESRPGWCGTMMFTEDRVNPLDFDVNDESTLVSSTASHNGNASNLVQNNSSNPKSDLKSQNQTSKPATTKPKPRPSTTNPKLKKFVFVNKATGKVLDLNRANGHAIQWDYHGGENQQWHIVKIAYQEYTFFKIQSVASGQILDFHTHDGTVIQWTVNGGTNQYWGFERVSGENFIINNVSNGKALEADLSTDKVRVNKETKADNQIWELKVVK